MEVEELQGRGHGDLPNSNLCITYMTYTAMDLWDLAKQLKQNVSETVSMWRFQLGHEGLINAVKPRLADLGQW